MTSAHTDTCPICKSTFCCCLEHLFPEQVEFYNRCKPGQAEPIRMQYENGQAEPQVKLGPESKSLSQENCIWPPSVGGSGDLGLLPKGAATGPDTYGEALAPARGLAKRAGPEPTPQTEEYQEAYTLAKTLAKQAGAGRTPSEGQTKRASLLEAASNILIGFWVSVGANMLVLPHFKNPGVFREAFIIGLIFTLISFVRSYLLRRLFNLFHVRQNRRSPWKP